MGDVCGRYVSAGDLADLAVLLGVNPFDGTKDVPETEAPEKNAHDKNLPDEQRQALARQRRFNLAPTDPVPAVLPGEAPGSRQLTLVSWGLVPAWSDLRSSAQRINARVETVLDKPAFRRAVRSRRCLLPADGCYEWVREPGGRKRPHFVHPADGRLLTFAGLYEHWHAPDGSRVRTSSILTGPAPEPLAWLHERAPLVVPPELWADWLDPTADIDSLLEAVRSAPLPEMATPEVSTAVNAVLNSSPELIQPVEPTADPAGGPAAEPVAAAEQVGLW